MQSTQDDGTGPSFPVGFYYLRRIVLSDPFLKKLRAKYRNLLSQVKKQIKFLRNALRGKESV